MRNKHKLKDEGASSALEMNLAALSLKWLSLTPNLSLTQALAQIN
jgi:hypothetical protein